MDGYILFGGVLGLVLLATQQFWSDLFAPSEEEQIARLMEYRDQMFPEAAGRPHPAMSGGGYTEYQLRPSPQKKRASRRRK